MLHNLSYQADFYLPPLRWEYSQHQAHLKFFSVSEVWVLKDCHH
jgi:hypothetical protein